MAQLHRIVPCLWFRDNAAEAVDFYLSVFPGARRVKTWHSPVDPPMPVGRVLMEEFELFGQRFSALNGGVDHPFTEALSLQLHCDDQTEIDRYWAALGNGGTEVQCGWIRDRFGLCWQVMPARMAEIMSSPGAARAMQAMMGMVKLDLAALEAAAAG